MKSRTSPPPIVLGCKAKDTLSGYEGIIIATSQYVNGCDRVGVQAPVTKGTNILPAQEWFDITRMVWTGKGVSVHRVVTGGPQNDPPSMRGIAGVVLLLVSLTCLGGCYIQDRTPAPDTAQHPTGGSLPADRAVNAQLYPRTFTGEIRPDVGIGKAY